jgi:hypothetical protein
MACERAGLVKGKNNKGYEGGSSLSLKIML